MVHFTSCCQLVKQLDYFLGIPSLLLDKDEERRHLYGKAGAFRPKPYGVEYRVLSNFWLKSPELMRWVYNTTHLAISELMKGNELARHYPQEAKMCINNPKDYYYGLESLKRRHSKLYEEVTASVRPLLA